MILSSLLGGRVFAGDEPVGYVTDVRFVLDEQSSDQPEPPARLHGLIVSPYARSSWFGFERTQVTAPRPVAALIRWRQRGAFLVEWADIAEISPSRVQLRPGARRWAADLPRSAVARPEFE